MPSGPSVPTVDTVSLQQGSLLAVTFIAVGGTLGSLYFSEILGLYPCELCWYQRIFMYPLVVVLGVATYQHQMDVWQTALPLAIGGVVVAGTHSYLQRFAAETCFVAIGCTNIQYTIGGLTIPNLALIAFASIALILVGAARIE